MISTLVLTLFHGDVAVLVALCWWLSLVQLLLSIAIFCRLRAASRRMEQTVRQLNAVARADAFAAALPTFGPPVAAGAADPTAGEP